jgi:hypothetical protein
MRKIITILLAVALLCGISTAAIADPASSTAYLKATGNAFDASGWQNTFTVGTASDRPAGSTDTVWHLVYGGDNSAQVNSMQITFTNGQVFSWVPADGFSTNGGGNNPGWVISAPYDWQIAYDPAGGVSHSFITVTTTGNGNVQFNISGYSQGKDPNGSLEVSVAANEQYNLFTDQPWDQTTYQPWWQKTYQRYQVPAFAKDISSTSSDTWVTRLTYDNDTASAKPINGGTFKNGHTYVQVNIAAASAPGGVWYTIADSSFNANGKKTPDQYNNPIDYQYNVQIANNKITISFDDRLISASVGAYAVGSLEVKSGNTLVSNPDKAFPGNAPKHYPNSVTIDMPSTNDNGCIYLYTHIEGVISWYTTTDQYKFVGWQDAPNLTTVSDAFVRNDFVSTQTGDTITETQATRAYNGTFTLTVKNAADSSAGQTQQIAVNNGQGSASIQDLAPGNYTLTLTGDNNYSSTQNVTVQAGQMAQASFGPITMTGADQTSTLPIQHMPDQFLAKTYLSPIYLDPIQLGTNDDPYGQYAIRLN